MKPKSPPLPRSLKMLLALAVALLLHAALLLHGVAPQVQGLVTSGSEDAVVTADGLADPADDEAAETPQSDQPIEVGFQEPAPEAIPEPAPEQKAPEPSPPAAVPAEKVAKPVIPPPEPARPKPEPPPKATVKKEPANPKTTTPAAKPAGKAVVNAGSDYANRVRQHLARFAAALPEGARGEARVQFVVQRDGRVSDIRLVKKSGHAGLDAVALSLPRNAQPLPLPGPVPQRLEVPVQAAATQP